jgi:ribosome biogenesis protein MAK21
MLLPPSPIWFDATPQGKLTQTQDDFEYARQLLEKDSEEYERIQSDRGFIHKILAAGTTADKLSTLTLLAQQSPVHNTKALQSLVQLGQKKSRSEALKALRAFGDWWSAGGAPDRKLRYWRDQPAIATSDAQRVLFYFEDWLKKLFWNVLQTLEVCNAASIPRQTKQFSLQRLSLDPLPYVRTQATSLIHAILSSKPEQEHNLLRLLVNKLGDSSKQLASRASYHLLQLLEPHPAMKMVIVGEIASLILRAPLSTSAKVHVDKAQDSAGINSHARYYATITLNQLVLSHSEQDTQLARKLIQIYFDLFNVLLRIQEISPSEEKRQIPERVKGRQEMKKDKTKRQERQKREQPSSNPNGKGEKVFVEMKEGHERFISAINTGLHRAVPYAALGASG